ncbi:MAG: hypothetical protein HY453_02180 [Parcubacteria group bacterium]|nr:hypothetical protein [Parcubacteria group bacterium]
MPYVVFGKIKTKDAIQALPFLYCMMEKNIRVYNVPDFESQFFDKMQFFSRWNRFMPETYLAESDNEVREYAKFFFHEKERLVVKELHGSGGKNVHIGTLEEFSLDLSYPVFVQRFLRSSGFPTFAGTVSDLRMQFIDHKLVDCFSRVASQGSLFTNTWKGAAVMPVEKKDIPEDVLAIVKEIQHEMKDIKRCFYCLDFFFEDGKPYLLEGGAKPGLSIANNDDERELKVFFRKLTESMLDRTLS